MTPREGAEGGMPRGGGRIEVPSAGRQCRRRSCWPRRCLKSSGAEEGIQKCLRTPDLFDDCDGAISSRMRMQSVSQSSLKFCKLALLRCTPSPPTKERSDLPCLTAFALLLSMGPNFQSRLHSWWRHTRAHNKDCFRKQGRSGFTVKFTIDAFISAAYNCQFFYKGLSLNASRRLIPSQASRPDWSLVLSLEKQCKTMTWRPPRTAPEGNLVLRIILQLADIALN